MRKDSKGLTTLNDSVKLFLLVKQLDYGFHSSEMYANL